MTARYAIYFAPEDSSELGLFGATVLRRRSLDASDWLNPQLAVEFPQPLVWAEQIRQPAHYGFHATLKAPFELAEGQNSDNLLSDFTEFSQTQHSVVLEGLGPVRTCRYDALAFDSQPTAVRQLAKECVTRFEKYRAPLTPTDLERRNPASLSDNLLENLNRYGYPHVMDEFNFHMTLSGQNTHENNAYFEWLCALYKSMVTKPPLLDRLCVFYQPDRSTPFVRIKECVFSHTV